MSTMPAGSGLSQLQLFRPPAPKARAADVHAISIPARSYTGDFYLTHRTSDRLWLAVGDVAGKGLPAALIMAMIQEELEHRLESCAQAMCDPSNTARRLHEFLRPNLPQSRFATAVIGHLHDNGTLVVANAGHPPALIRRRDGSIEEIASSGPVLGLLASSEWTSTTRFLARGESLLLYTDGVIELTCRSGEEFGVERLKEAFSKAGAARSAREIADGVTTSIRSHAETNEDDLTLVVVQR
jgi:phosphoserine phosphatase RsbU/P